MNKIEAIEAMALDVLNREAHVLDLEVERQIRKFLGGEQPPRRERAFNAWVDSTAIRGASLMLKRVFVYRKNMGGLTWK